MKSLTMMIKEAQNFKRELKWSKDLKIIKYFKKRKFKRILRMELQEWLDNKDKLGILYPVDLQDAFNMMRLSDIEFYKSCFKDGEAFSFVHHSGYGLPKIRMNSFIDHSENDKISITVSIKEGSKKNSIIIEFETINDPFRLLKRSKKQGSGNLVLNTERNTIVAEYLQKEYNENTKNTIVLEGIYHMTMLYVKTAIELFLADL